MPLLLGRMYVRDDTAANWSSNNPVLALSEMGYDTTNKILKIGDGSTAWNSLTVAFYRAGGTDVALADGGTGASLTDPNADRILFWDDSVGAMTWLDLSGLEISGTTLRPVDRLVTTASNTSWTIDCNTTDVAEQTAVAGALTINAPSNPYSGKKLTWRIKDNATARALTFNSVFDFSFGFAAPTTTVISKWLYWQTTYNATSSKHDVLAVGQQV